MTKQNMRDIFNPLTGLIEHFWMLIIKVVSPAKERTSEGVPYANGTTTNIGRLPGFLPITSPTAINDSGQVVGTASNASSFRAFLYTGGIMTSSLGNIGGGQQWANDINNNGQIVGGSYISYSGFHAFLSQGGNMIDLGAMGHSNSSANAINDNGQVVGSIQAGYNSNGGLNSVHPETPI